MNFNIGQWYDRVFGNNDGKFDFKDIPNHAVLIVGVVVDLVMLVAEYRVWSVGYLLTGNVMLAIGFVLISSLPFYLGQLAYLYNRANEWQQRIAVGMVVMGLLVSAYYGFADYIISTNITLSLSGSANIPLDLQTLYVLAVVCTVALIVIGLIYVLVDDDIANTIKAKRIEGKFKTAKHEMDLKTRLVEEAKKLREAETSLANTYGADYEALQRQFEAAANKANPTRGNGNTR